MQLGPRTTCKLCNASRSTTAASEQWNPHERGEWDNTLRQVRMCAITGTHGSMVPPMVCGPTSGIWSLKELCSLQGGLEAAPALQSCKSPQPPIFHGPCPSKDGMTRLSPAPEMGTAPEGWR